MVVSLVLRSYRAACGFGKARGMPALQPQGGVDKKALGSCKKGAWELCRVCSMGRCNWPY